jgi:hypothetical protein
MAGPACSTAVVIGYSHSYLLQVATVSLGTSCGCITCIFEEICTLLIYLGANGTPYTLLKPSLAEMSGSDATLSHPLALDAQTYMVCRLCEPERYSPLLGGCGLQCCVAEVGLHGGLFMPCQEQVLRELLRKSRLEWITRTYHCMFHSAHCVLMCCNARV